MVLRQKLTPESALTAPRRSPAVASPSGRLAYFTVSTHTFRDDGRSKGTTKKEFFLLDLGTGEHWPFAAVGDSDSIDKMGDVAWVPGRRSGGVDELLWLRPSADKAAPAGTTEVVVAAATASPDAPATAAYVAGVVPAPIRALRLKDLPDGSVAFAVAGLVDKDGTLYNEKAEEAGDDDKADGKTGTTDKKGKLIDTDDDDDDTTPSASTDSPRKPGSTARIYDTWQVREWDTYLKPQPYAIWYSSLVKEARGEGEGEAAGSASSTSGSRWSLATPLHNALKHAPARLEAPGDIYEPGDSSQSYDIGAQGVVFATRDPAPADPLHSGCSDVYYVPLDSFTAATAYKPARIGIALAAASTSLSPPGQCANPRFSPDGTMIAFLRSPLANPDDIRLHMGHIVSGAAFDVVATVINGPGGPGGGASAADAASIVPDAFEFAPSGKAVFLEANDCGRRSLFVLDLRAGARPRVVSRHGSLAAYSVVRRRRGRDGDSSEATQAAPSDLLSAYAVLISGSSFVESSFYHMVDLEDDFSGGGSRGSPANTGFEPRVVSTATKDGAKFGLSHARQVSEMYFEGGGDGGDDEYCVQAWVVRPSGSDEPSPDGTIKKYPLALLVHGGPASAWNDEWQPRWNAAVWAEQGYIVVLPNITGSTGFGLEHTARINGSWGGYPYEDLVKCMAYLRDVPDIDLSRAVLCGASYGGYMVNWVLGSPLAKQFNAAVTHDSVFDTAHMGLNSDFPDGIATFQGSGFPWDNFDAVERWNPARPDRLARWRTHAPPTLVVHSDKDFRCPVTDGLSVFRALQFQGVPSRYLTFPDENHWVLNPENALVWHRVVLEWVNRWREVKRDV